MAALMGLCRIDGCGRPVHQGRRFRRSVCGSHHSRKTRTGSYGESMPVTPLGSWHYEEASYETAHKRVTARRGPACDQRCVDCSAQAAEWSYDRNGAGRERTATRASGDRRITVVYSIDPNDYTPRCRSCHRKFDARKVVV